MADIQTLTGEKQKGPRRSKKLSTRIDLTPMVDLGFLLITFFVFTATLSSSRVMKIALPADGNDATTSAAKTISILLAANNIIYYYNGDSINNMHSTNFSPGGLRAIIRDEMMKVLNKYGDAHETVVLIKPTEYAVYRNAVDVLDEMQINDVFPVMF